MIETNDLFFSSLGIDYSGKISYFAKNNNYLWTMQVFTIYYLLK